MTDLSKYPNIATVGPKQLKNTVPIISLNCSNGLPHGAWARPCKLDGVALTSAVQSEGCNGCDPPPAVRVFRGTVVGLTVMNSQSLGGNDVVNAENVPIGNWVSRSWGGWTMVGSALSPANVNLTGPGAPPSNLTASRSSPSHALLVGVSGNSQASFAIETSGEMFYGDGDSGWHTGVRRHISNSTHWAPGSIAPGAHATKLLKLAGAIPGDIVSATHASLDATNLDLSCSARIVLAPSCSGCTEAEMSSVMIVLSNRGASAVAVAAGIVRAAIVQYI